MLDISIRIPINIQRHAYIEKNYVAKQLLPGIKDTMYKPARVGLRKYHPNKICMRLRKFDDGTKTITEIKTIKTTSGYSDEKRKVNEEELKNYEIWGKMSVISSEYKLEIGGEVVTILQQKIDPIGEFIKIETPSEISMKIILKELKVEDSEKIEHNAAVMLGEKLGLI